MRRFLLLSFSVSLTWHFNPSHCGSVQEEEGRVELNLRLSIQSKRQTVTLTINRFVSVGQTVMQGEKVKLMKKLKKDIGVDEVIQKQ